MEITKFYRCCCCGNIVTMMRDAGVPMCCCGREMEQLWPNSVNASVVVHKPVITIHNGVVCVDVGKEPHPMITEHYIQWIYMQTNEGGQFKWLMPGDRPRAAFNFCADKPVAAYAYCNLHGLWMTELHEQETNCCQPGTASCKCNY